MPQIKSLKLHWVPNGAYTDGHFSSLTLNDISKSVFKLKCINIFPPECRRQSCITAHPVTNSCSVSVSECGLSAPTRRSNLSRWSCTDLTSADKVYLAESSRVFFLFFRNSPSFAAQICSLPRTRYLCCLVFSSYCSVSLPISAKN